MDAVLDLWLNTVYNDPHVLGSDVGPVVYPHGTAIYLQNYLSTMFQISDIVVDKEEIAMSLGIKLELQEESALPATVSSGSNETGSVSETNRHQIERKMRELLVAQGLPCASCPKSKYMLLPLSDDCKETVEGVPPLRRWLQLVVTCGDAQEVYRFELRLHPSGMRIDKEAGK